MHTRGAVMLLNRGSARGIVIAIVAVGLAVMSPKTIGTKVKKTNTGIPAPVTVEIMKSIALESLIM